MKKINYIKYLIFKEWLPIIIIFASVLLILNFTFATTVGLYYEKDSILDMNFEGIFVAWAAMAIVMSFLVFSYRFSTKRSDMFYQVPLKPGELKNIRLLTGLFCVVAAMIISFVIPFLVLLIRHSCAPNYYQDIYHDSFNKVNINFGLVFVSFLSAIGMISLEYFISSYFFSLCHKPTSGILINIAFHAFMAFFFFALFNTLNTRCSPDYQETDLTREFYVAGFTSLEYSPGFVMACRIPHLVFRSAFLCDYIQTDFLKGEHLYVVMFYVQLGIHILLGIGACVLLLLKKEKSGELCNKYGFTNKKLNQLFFITIIPVVITFASCSATTNFTFYFMYLIIAGAYYFLFALFSGTFKIQLSGYIYIGAMVLLLFTLSPFLDAITGANKYNY